MQSFQSWASFRSFVPFFHHLFPLLALALGFGHGFVVKLLLFLASDAALLVEVDHGCLAHPFLLPVQIASEGLDICDDLFGLHLGQAPEDVLLAILHLDEYLPVPLVDVVGLKVIDLNEVLADLLDDFHPFALDVLLLLDI